MAGPGIDLKIDGDKELIAQFKLLGKGLGKQALTYATIQGANVIKREASLRSPRGKTGDLKRSIKSVVLKQKQKLVRVGVSFQSIKSPVFYGLFVEKGTKSRQRKRWRKKPLSTGPASTGKMVARPFLEPAYDAKRRQAADVIKKELWRIIMKLKKRGMAGG
tara:strand:+ start:542 stop:1027 length:486 start_codon:yes stop_codon:yes gene_type:complete